MPRSVSLLSALVLFCASSTLAAPHALLPADLAAAALEWPSVPQSSNSNETDSSWFAALVRRFDTNTESFLANPKTVSKSGKIRTVPGITPIPIRTTSKVVTGGADATTSTTQAAPVTTTKSTSPAAQVTSTSSTVTKTTSTAAPTSTSFPLLANMPASVSSMYDSLSGGKKCTPVLDTKSSGFTENGNGGNYAHYCGDVASKPKVVMWMSNMDVDCDGGKATGPCGNDPSHQSQTSFTYKNAPIDAQAVPYVVINDDKYFSPSKMGIQGLATVGVVCGGKLTWAVFADTNPFGSMGEGSVKLAQTCFGSSMTGNNGHGPADVLYFAFTGADAVDPLAGTDYQSLAKRGNALLSRLG